MTVAVRFSCGTGGSRALRTGKQVPLDHIPSSSTPLFAGCHPYCRFCIGPFFRFEQGNVSRRNEQMAAHLARDERDVSWYCLWTSARQQDLG